MASCWGRGRKKCIEQRLFVAKLFSRYIGTLPPLRCYWSRVKTSGWVCGCRRLIYIINNAARCEVIIKISARGGRTHRDSYGIIVIVINAFAIFILHFSDLIFEIQEILFARFQNSINGTLQHSYMNDALRSLVSANILKQRKKVFHCRMFHEKIFGV